MLTTYKNNLLHRLKIARGHFEKVIRMVENDEYCLDITQQTYAIQNAIKKVDEVILEHHLKTCVKDALVKGKDVDEKVEEILEVFKRKCPRHYVGVILSDPEPSRRRVEGSHYKLDPETSSG